MTKKNQENPRMSAPLQGPGLKEGYEIKSLRHKVTVTPSYEAKSETKKQTSDTIFRILVNFPPHANGGRFLRNL